MKINKVIMKPFLTTLLSLLFVGGLYAQDEAVNDTVYIMHDGFRHEKMVVTLSQWTRTGLYIDWGDGNVERMSGYHDIFGNSDTTWEVEHTYSVDGEYQIKLYVWSGDLKSRLLGLELAGYFGLRRSLDVHDCVALERLDKLGGLTSLDVRGCTALKSLEVSATSLDVRGCTSLRTLDCRGGELTSLDVSGCTSLQTLNCYGNQLNSLNVSGCTALQTLNCSRNRLTSLNVSGCTSLRTLDCYGNQLNSLNVSDCVRLKNLNCRNNQITSLNLRGLDAITIVAEYGNADVQIGGNPLDSLNMSGCTALIELSYSRGQLKWLDVSGCSELATLYCYNNQINVLNANGCVELRNLDCRNNQLISLNLRGTSISEVDATSTSGLGSVRIGGNDSLDSLDVRDCAYLCRVLWPNGRLKWLGVGGNAALKELNCDTNQLTSLDVSGCPKLRRLYCRDNRLTSLDLSGTSIAYIGGEYDCLSRSRISGNPLDSLDVSNCIALYSLDCANGRLKWLNVSGNTKLSYLYCDTNQLTSLDVSGCKALYELHCTDNRLASLDVSGCKALYELHCTDNRLASLDVSGCKALYELHCTNNRLTLLDVSGLGKLSYLSCANNELTTINVKDCSNLWRGDCSNNHLPLSMLAPISTSIDKSPQVIRGIELQTFSPWDLSSEMLRAGKRTDVYCDSADSYGFEADGAHLVFYKSGTYQVTLENEYIREFVGNKSVPVPVLYEVMVRPSDFVPAPVFSENKEGFQGYVSISCLLAKAEIYYTDDGSEPTINSTLYTEAIPMDRNMTIKAIAVFGGIVSQVATYEVKIPEAPVFSVPSGVVPRGTRVNISCATAGAKIYCVKGYDLIGEATGGISMPINESMTLRAWAEKGNRKSQEVTATYTIDNTPNETALSASTLRVYAQDGTIYLSEPTGEVEVFTTSGRRVYRGVSTAIPVPRPGVYVVTAAGQKYKVGVK